MSDVKGQLETVAGLFLLGFFNLVPVSALVQNSKVCESCTLHKPMMSQIRYELYCEGIPLNKFSDYAI